MDKNKASDKWRSVFEVIARNIESHVGEFDDCPVVWWKWLGLKINTKQPISLQSIDSSSASVSVLASFWFTKRSLLKKIHTMIKYLANRHAIRVTQDTQLLLAVILSGYSVTKNLICVNIWRILRAVIFRLWYTEWRCIKRCWFYAIMASICALITGSSQKTANVSACWALSRWGQHGQWAFRCAAGLAFLKHASSFKRWT